MFLPPDQEQEKDVNPPLLFSFKADLAPHPQSHSQTNCKTKTRIQLNWAFLRGALFHHCPTSYVPPLFKQTWFHKQLRTAKNVGKYTPTSNFFIIRNTHINTSYWLHWHLKYENGKLWAKIELCLWLGLPTSRSPCLWANLSNKYLTPICARHCARLQEYHYRGSLLLQSFWPPI